MQITSCIFFVARKKKRKHFLLHFIYCYKFAFLSEILLLYVYFVFSILFCLLYNSCRLVFGVFYCSQFCIMNILSSSSYEKFFLPTKPIYPAFNSISHSMCASSFISFTQMFAVFCWLLSILLAYPRKKAALEN